jgi:hypothetical protein
LPSRGNAILIASAISCASKTFARRSSWVQVRPEIVLRADDSGLPSHPGDSPEVSFMLYCGRRETALSAPTPTRSWREPPSRAEIARACPSVTPRRRLRNRENEPTVVMVVSIMRPTTPCIRNRANEPTMMTERAVMPISAKRNVKSRERTHGHDGRIGPTEAFRSHAKSRERTHGRDKCVGDVAGLRPAPKSRTPGRWTSLLFRGGMFNTDRRALPRIGW